MRRLCVTWTKLSQRKYNEFRVCTLLVLTLDLRWSDFLLASTFTRGKMFTFLNTQKMCAEVDAHIKSSSGVLVKSSTNSDARPANHLHVSHFLCVGRA